MYPGVGNRRAVGLENESIGVAPKPDCMPGEVNHKFLGTVREEALYFRSLINFDISEQHFILDIPNLELLSSVGYQQMTAQADF